VYCFRYGLAAQKEQQLVRDESLLPKTRVNFGNEMTRCETSDMLQESEKNYFQFDDARKTPGACNLTYNADREDSSYTLRWIELERIKVRG